VRSHEHNALRLVANLMLWFASTAAACDCPHGLFTAEDARSAETVFEFVPMELRFEPAESQ
jgi:hypothetical protein